MSQSTNARNLSTAANANARALLARLPTTFGKLTMRDRFDACRMAQAGLVSISCTEVTITALGKQTLAEVVS